jgi:hypothetical protein
MSQAIFVVFHRPTPRYNLWRRDFSLSQAFFRFIPNKIDRVYVVDSGWFFREPPHPRAVVFHSDHNPYWLYLERHLPEVKEDSVLIVHPDTLLYGRDCVSNTFQTLKTWEAVGEDDSFFAASSAVFRRSQPLADFPAFIRASGLRVKPPNRDKRDVLVQNEAILPLGEPVQSPRTAFYHLADGGLGMELVSTAENDPYLFEQRVLGLGRSRVLRAIMFKQCVDAFTGNARDYFPMVRDLIARSLWDRYVRTAQSTLRFLRPVTSSHHA